MKFNQKRAKESAIDTGAAVAGAVAGLAVANKAAAMIAEKSPGSTITRHVPAILLGAVIAAQALDLVPDSPLVDSALQGIAVVTGMQAVREYTGANTPAGLTATSGVAALVNQYVPAFQSDGQAALPATSAATAAALQGLGLIDYRDPAEAMRIGGATTTAWPAAPVATARPQVLGNLPAGAQPKILG